MRKKSLILYILITLNLTAYASNIDAEIIKDIDFFEMMNILDDEEAMDIDFETLDLEENLDGENQNQGRS